MNPYQEALKYCGMPEEPTGVWRDLRDFLVERTTAFDEQSSLADHTNPFRAILAMGGMNMLSYQRRVRSHLELLAEQFDARQPV